MKRKTTGFSGLLGALFLMSMNIALADPILFESLSQTEKDHLALGKQVIKPQDIIARNPEYMPHAVGVKALDEVLANRK